MKKMEKLDSVVQNSATITLSVCDGLYDRLTNAVCQIFLLSGAGEWGALSEGGLRGQGEVKGGL